MSSKTLRLIGFFLAVVAVMAAVTYFDLVAAKTFGISIMLLGIALFVFGMLRKRE